jgi:hypothetical protein
MASGGTTINIGKAFPTPEEPDYQQYPTLLKPYWVTGYHSRLLFIVIK